MALDREQLKRGLRALYGFIAMKASSAPSAARLPLFEEDEFIYLQVALKKTPVKATTKPARIPLQHSLYAAETECCLIIKDPPRAAAASAASASVPASSSSSSSAGLKEYFAAHPVAGLSRIVTVHKLRSEYGRFKQRRELLALYDVFLADDRVLPVLPAVLGSKFFDKKKQPMPVNLRLRDKAREVQAALSSTAMFVPAGSCLVLRVGRTSFSRQQVEDNIAGCVEAVVHRLPGKWRNVQMIGVKTRDSITIPVYNSLPLQEIRGAAQDSNGRNEEETEEDERMDGKGDDSEDEQEEEQAANGAAEQREEEGEEGAAEHLPSAVQRKRKREESDAGSGKLRLASTAAAATRAVVTTQRNRASAAAQQPPPVAKQRKTESATSTPTASPSLAVAAASKKATTPTAAFVMRKAATVPASFPSSSRQAAAAQETATASGNKKRKIEKQPAAAAAATVTAAATGTARLQQKAEAGKPGLAARQQRETKRAEKSATVKPGLRPNAGASTAAGMRSR